MERYCFQSTKDSKSNRTVYWKIKNCHRKRRPTYQNDLWLRFIRTVIFLSSFKFLILSFVIFSMKTFCEHKLIKKMQKIKATTSKFEQMELYLPLYFLIFRREIPLAHHKMLSHCMIIEFIILIPVTINFLTIFLNNMKVPVVFWFYCPTWYILFQLRFGL